MTGKAKLRSAHQELAGTADRFRHVLVEQINSLLSSTTLGVPIESRVKTWASVEERLVRKPIDLKSITDLDDLIGIRVILLFRRDLETALKAIREHFDVLSSEDKASMLEEAQFGYQSYHLVVRPPKEWLSVPSYANFGSLKAELQVRTLAQHIWAAASHKLQYKQEQGVPPPLKRSINRVSALLETVDLEFERVLSERQSYAEAIDAAPPSGPLNVDLIAAILAELLPPQNHSADEDYSDLLQDLKSFDVKTAKDLRSLIKRNLRVALADDAKRVKEEIESEDDGATISDIERVRRGVFFTHVGLTRMAMNAEFGERFDKYMNDKPNKRSKTHSE